MCQTWHRTNYGKYEQETHACIYEGMISKSESHNVTLFQMVIMQRVIINLTLSPAFPQDDYVCVQIHILLKITLPAAPDHIAPDQRSSCRSSIQRCLRYLLGDMTQAGARNTPYLLDVERPF
jgi:hypothetical protein